MRDKDIGILWLFFCTTVLFTYVCSLECPKDTSIELECSDVTDIDSLRARFDDFSRSKIRSLCIVDSLFFTTLNLTRLVMSFPSVVNLTVQHCRLYDIVGQSTNDIAVGNLSQIQSITLHHTRLSEIDMDLIALSAPKLVRLDLSGNHLYSVGEVTEPTSLQYLNLAHNRLHKIPSGLPSSLYVLNASDNGISYLRRSDFRQIQNLRVLDLSYNPVSHTLEEDCFSDLLDLKQLILHTSIINRVNMTTLLAPLSSLESLNLSLKNCPVDLPPFPRLPTLATLTINCSQLEVIQTSALSRLSQLRSLSLHGSSRFIGLYGNLSDLTRLEEIDLRDKSVGAFDEQTFAVLPRGFSSIEINSDDLYCDCRLRGLHERLLYSLKDARCGSDSLASTYYQRRNDENCSSAVILYESKTIPEHMLVSRVVYALYSESSVVSCWHYADPPPEVAWYRIRDEDQDVYDEFIGHWRAYDDTTETLANDYSASVLPGGQLHFHSTEKSAVGRYKCVVANGYANVSSSVSVRIDYSYWRTIRLYSIICSVAVCVGSAVIHAIWSAIRQFALWRIQKLATTSRLRAMLRSVEEYKVRQMETLHGNYTSRVNGLREYYRTQTGNIYATYTSQTERFRDYKTGTMEYVHGTFDSVRDNYDGQCERVREYCSRQMERVWENYQSQVDRIRAFSQQQRMRVAQQYRVKQRYIDKIMVSLALRSELVYGPTPSKADLHAMLNDLAPPTFPEPGTSRSQAPLVIPDDVSSTQSADFASLPDLDLDDNIVFALPDVEEPLGGGEMEPLGGGEMEPLGGGEMKPLGGGEMEPLGGGEMKPLGGGEMEPLGGGEMKPLGGGEMEPLGGGEMEPLGGGEMEPLRRAEMEPLRMSETCETFV